MQASDYETSLVPLECPAGQTLAARLTDERKLRLDTLLVAY